MLRTRNRPATPSSPQNGNSLKGGPTTKINGISSNNSSSNKGLLSRYFITLLLMAASLFLGVAIGKSHSISTDANNNNNNNNNSNESERLTIQPPRKMRSNNNDLSSVNNAKAGSTTTTKTEIPYEFHRLIDRATQNKQHCDVLQMHKDPNPVYNNHTAHLPQFGILKAIDDYEKGLEEGTIPDYPYQCVLPPENECAESKFTVIFMAYNPERLDKMYNQIVKFVQNEDFKQIVHEVVIVWNGDRAVEETKMGKTLVDLTRMKPVRISYPLKAGYPNDLMNRYHPRLEIQTKAIMYYDDDGPFYSYKATLAGFELWKRNSNAQIGAMARRLDVGKRQLDEKNAILNGPGDRFFVSHCPGDSIRYNFNEFANFGANMVLPSGSFLHSNYLCFLWHPLFAEIRDYVKRHPVNPDDGTVSILVSQLSGRAPKVYSRRINESKDKRRRLSSLQNETDNLIQIEHSTDGYNKNDDEDDYDEICNHNNCIYEQQQEQQRMRRRLMDGINWDTHEEAHVDKKHLWGQLRSDAANSLVRYFGSINSGSIGWCYGTPHHDQKAEKCQPEMAKIGMIPWMTRTHEARPTCP